MIVRVPDIGSEGLSVTEAAALGPVYRDPTWRLDGVRLHLERDGIDVFVTGEVRAAVSQACDTAARTSPVTKTSIPSRSRWRRTPSSRHVGSRYTGPSAAASVTLNPSLPISGTRTIMRANSSSTNDFSRKPGQYIGRYRHKSSHLTTFDPPGGLC